jgi:KDO2-lipid IV(A) lauroyltransferase
MRGNPRQFPAFVFDRVLYPPAVQRTAQFLGYLALRFVICLIQALPLWTCAWLARCGASLMTDVIRMRAKVIDENLRHAFPDSTPQERRRLARGMWENLILFACEVFHTARKINDLNWPRYVSLRGEGHVLDLFLEERPTIMVTAHYGNFEFAGFFFSLLGHRIFSVARPLDNPFFDGYLRTFRGARGQMILAKQDDYDEILAVMDRGDILGVVGDQYAGSKGCFVEFFGRQASAYKSIAVLSLQYAAPIVVGTCRRVGGPLQYELHVHAELDPRTLPPEQANVKFITQWYTRALEQAIRQAPEQYWWLHRRWKDNRPARRQARQLPQAA